MTMGDYLLRSIDEVISDFELLVDWEERYLYIIDLGKKLAGLSPEEQTPQTQVHGCTSQVWVITSVEQTPEGPVMHLRGDSDSHIVRGLLALLILLYTGKKSSEILAIDPEPIFHRLDLREHLTPQRSNGINALVGHIRGRAGAFQGEE